MPMKCPKCGYDNEESALFCNLCQEVFKKAASSSAEPGPPQRAALVFSSSPAPPSGGTPSAAPAESSAPLDKIDLVFSEQINTYEIHGDPAQRRLVVNQRVSGVYKSLGGIIALCLTPIALACLVKVFSNPWGLIFVGIYVLLLIGIGASSGVILEGSTRTVKGWSKFYGKLIPHEDRRIGPNDSIAVTREWRSSRRRRWEVFAVRIKTGDEEIDLIEVHDNPKTGVALAQLAGAILGIKVEQSLAPESGD